MSEVMDWRKGHPSENRQLFEVVMDQEISVDCLLVSLSLLSHFFSHKCFLFGFVIFPSVWSAAVSGKG